MKFRIVISYFAFLALFACVRLEGPAEPALPSDTKIPPAPTVTNEPEKQSGVVEYIPNISNGLELGPSTGDGHYIFVKNNDGSAVQTASIHEDGLVTSYLYFRVDDDFYFGSGTPITINIEYLDEDYGPLVLEYDATGGGEAAYRAVYPAMRQNTKEWKTATYNLADASFTNRQNLDADFRLSSYRTALTIRKVSISLDKGAGSGTPVSDEPVSNAPADYPSRLGDRAVFTHYFYWYDINSGTHIREGLTDVPADLYQTSMFDVNWHRRQLKDISYSGIDVILPVVWYDEMNLWWAFPSLETLAEALEEVRLEGIKPPSVGMFVDTTSSIGKDLRLDSAQAEVYQAVNQFFHAIPREYWALTEDGRPILWFYYSQFPSAYDQTFIEYIYSHFEQDFQVRPYLVFDNTWDYPAETVNGERVIHYDAPPLRYDASVHFGGAIVPNTTSQVTSIGPGYDNRGVILPVIDSYTVVDRNQGVTYRSAFGQALRCSAPWLAIETWNEFHEATEVAETMNHGREYIEMTREFTRLFKEAGPAENAPITTPYTDTKGISITLGDQDISEGLGMFTFNYGDGLNQPITAGDKPARVTLPSSAQAETSYLYFSVDDGFYFERPETVKLSVEYFDEGFEPIYVEYDRQPCGAKNDNRLAYSQVLLERRQNTMQWRTAVIELADARFANHQNDGADFRLVTGRSPLTVHSVVLEKVR